jgi:hypothetical protein
MRQRPLAIAGSRQAFPARVRAPQRAAESIDVARGTGIKKSADEPHAKGRQFLPGDAAARILAAAFRASPWSTAGMARSYGRIRATL